MESGESFGIHFGVAACEVRLCIAPSVIFFLSEYDLCWCVEQFGECCSGLVDSSNLYFQKITCKILLVCAYHTVERVT